MDFVMRYLIMCSFFVVILCSENSKWEKHYVLTITYIFLVIGLIFLI